MRRIADEITDDRFTIVKQTIETVNNTTTLQDDNDFIFVIPGGGQKWFFDTKLLVTATGTTPDIKMQWNSTNSSTVLMQRGGSGATVAVGVTPDLLGSGNTTAGTGNGTTIVIVLGTITSSTNDTLCTFRWAQNTADASNLSLEAGSRMDVYRVL